MSSSAEDSQIAWDVKSTVSPSLNVPVAVNCAWNPKRGSETLAGWTSICCSTPEVTVTCVVPVTSPTIAETVIGSGSADTAVSRPLSSASSPIVATVGSEEPHSAVSVTSCVLPSVKIAVALNCSVRPLGTSTFAGEIWISSSSASVTVTSAESENVPNVAVIVIGVEVSARAVTSP